MKIFVHIFFAIETREFSLSGLPRQTNMAEKANKSNCLLHLVRLLACLNFCGSNTNYFYFSMSAFLWVSAIVEASSTTTLSITSPPTHAPSFFSRLAGSRDKLSWAIIKISSITVNNDKTLSPRESRQSSPGMKISKLLLLGSDSAIR